MTLTRKSLEGDRVLWKEYGCKLQDTFRLFGVARVRYELVAHLLSFGTAICGRRFNLKWWRLLYTLLMRPNKVEAAVQCFCISSVGVRGIFW